MHPTNTCLLNNPHPVAARAVKRARLVRRAATAASLEAKRVTRALAVPVMDKETL